MKKKGKIILMILCIVTAAFLYGGNWAVDAGLSRDGWGSKVRKTAQQNNNKEAEDPNSSMYRVRLYRQSIQAETEQFEQEVKEKEVPIRSYDGLKLAGFLRENPNSHRYVICFHGYRATHQEITDLGFARRFYKMGYSVLCPDQRAHGKSEGKWIGMGWLERKDVLAWTEYIVQMDSEAEIVLFGESMGAASVLAATGQPLPSAVKAVISDSGYAGTATIASEAMWKQAHIPSFPLLNIGNIFCWFKAGYTLKRNDIRDALKDCQIPVLLFQGSDDNIVSSDNLEILYDAIPNDHKEKVMINGADHVCSSQLEPDLYWSYVYTFLKDYVK